MNRLHDQIKHWYLANKRDLPWRNTSDAYVIWLSEIILQQTRVAQGLPYFERFLTKFPTIDLLALAPEDEVLRLWQGLGYYSRARNMHATAKFIYQELNSIFPSTYQEIKKLKGVGDYTAAAIASFAYGEKVPVLDGNVFRVIARYFGVFDDISKSSSRQTFMDILWEEIPSKNPADFNQSMMEFGALHCTPKKPNCSSCPLADSCFAFVNKKIDILPVKNQKIVKTDRFLNYVILINNNKIALQKRSKGDIWQGLYQFILHESKEKLDPESYTSNYTPLNIEKISLYQACKKHLLSHQNIYSQMIAITVKDKGLYDFYTLEEIEKLPKPKLIENFLKIYFYKNV